MRIAFIQLLRQLCQLLLHVAHGSLDRLALAIGGCGYISLSRAEVIFDVIAKLQSSARNRHVR